MKDASRIVSGSPPFMQSQRERERDFLPRSASRRRLALSRLNAGIQAILLILRSGKPAWGGAQKNFFGHTRTPEALCAHGGVFEDARPPRPAGALPIMAPVAQPLMPPAGALASGVGAAQGEPRTGAPGLRSLRHSALTSRHAARRPTRCLPQAAAGDHDAPAAPMPCALMFPLVRDVWRASEMDLSDGGRWITDASLGALAYLDGLASLRLTLCRFLTDSGSAQLPRLSGLQALDVSWTELGDRAAGHLAGCPGLTSLNLTGLGGLTDRGVASLLPLRRLQRLSLASTSAADAAPTPARRRSGACSRVLRLSRSPTPR